MFKRAASYRGSDARAAGDAARDGGEWAAAVVHYRAHLDASPDDAGIWVQFGNCAKEAGDYETALAAYRHALELRPGEADTHLQLGHLLKLMGRMHTALDAYRQALALDPKLADARHEVTRLDKTILALPFLLPASYLDVIKAKTPNALVAEATKMSSRDDVFRLYEEIITREEKD